MKRLKLLAVVGALLTIVFAPLAYSSGLWFGLPIQGGPGYCSTATAGVPGTTPVCTSQTPAGTTVYPSLTGGEMIPSDVSVLTSTWAPQSNVGNAGPQQVYVPISSAASGAYLLTNTGGLSAAATLTVPNGITNVVLNATGTITDYTVILPTVPYDGQLVRFATVATLTAVHVTASTAATVGTETKVFSPVVPEPSTSLSITSVTVGGFSYLYNVTNNKWFRLQ